MVDLFGLGLAVISIIIIVFATVAIIRNKDLNVDWEDDFMFKNFYQYLVLFATLMMTIGGSIGVFMSVADYVSPSTYYQTFPDYKMMREDVDGDGKKDNVSEEELKESYEQIIVEEKERMKEVALNGIIKSLGWILIPFPIFIYFQRSVRKKEDKSE